MSHKPTLYTSLVQYRSFMQSCDKKYLWHAVYAYACRFRATLATNNFWEFHKSNTVIYITTFDTTTVKRRLKQCFRCKSLEHSVQDCPFPAPSSLEENAKKTNTSFTAREVPAGVRTVVADAPTCANRAEDRNHAVIAETAVNVKPILNHDALSEGLASHPDHAFVSRILEFCNNGVSIGYQGPRGFRDCSNWPSAQVFHDEIDQIIQNDINKGRKLGPFKTPPTENFVTSPMGAFRKRSGKIRVIQDLSWPPGASINDHISSDDYSVSYISVDDIIRRIKLYGPHTMMAKLDLSDAFKYIMVRREDWELLGTVWERKVEGIAQKLYYMDVVLPFGLRSAPRLFDDFANAIQYIMKHRGASECFHKKDDFITLGPPYSSQCHYNLDIMINMCHDVGFVINQDKLVGPSTIIEYLGFVIDTNNMQIRISKERLNNIYGELCQWQSRKTCSKRQLLSLIGKLIFISKVVRSGRTFVRRLIERSKNVKHLHHRIQLNDSVRRDINWWLLYLPSWNGVSVFMDDYWTRSV